MLLVFASFCLIACSSKLSNHLHCTRHLFDAIRCLGVPESDNDLAFSKYICLIHDVSAARSRRRFTPHPKLQGIFIDPSNRPSPRGLIHGLLDVGMAAKIPHRRVSQQTDVAPLAGLKIHHRGPPKVYLFAIARMLYFF